jgi:hypothetical protein
MASRSSPKVPHYSQLFTRDLAAEDFTARTGIPLKDDPVLGVLLHDRSIDECIANPDLLLTPGSDSPRDAVAAAFRAYVIAKNPTKKRPSSKELKSSGRVLSKLADDLVELFCSKRAREIRACEMVRENWQDAVRTVAIFKDMVYEDWCGTQPAWINEPGSGKLVQVNALWLAIMLREVVVEYERWEQDVGPPTDQAFRGLLRQFERVDGMGDRRHSLTPIALLCFAAGVSDKRRRMGEDSYYLATYETVRATRTRMRKFDKELDDQSAKFLRAANWLKRHAESDEEIPDGWFPDIAEQPIPREPPDPPQPKRPT